MKRILKPTFLLALAVIVIGAAVVSLTQWDNIKAAVLGLQHSEVEIDSIKTDVKTSFAEKTGIDLDAIEAAVNASPKEDIGDAAEDSSSQPEQDVLPPDSSSDKEPAPSTKPLRDTSKIEEILSRFYTLQSSYVSQVEGIKSDAIAQYLALPRGERSTADKIRIGRSAFSRAVKLESECDAKITVLIKELRAALREAGMSETIAKDAERYYASEKGLLKAKLISKYKKYLS